MIDMMQEAILQYERALRSGQRYYKEAISRGEYPYPPVLDDIVNEANIAGTAELGVINIPTERIAGTKSAGRTAALAGNFMPLLDLKTEFGAKWTALCVAHLGNEGIRDAIRCYEYMGRFYIQEGNKRASVMMSYRAPSIPAHVIRMIPVYSEDHDVQVYYEFMRFYALSRLYSVEFRHRGCYARQRWALPRITSGLRKSGAAFQPALRISARLSKNRIQSTMISRRRKPCSYGFRFFPSRRSKT